MTATIQRLLDDGTRLTTNGTDIIIRENSEYIRYANNERTTFEYDPSISYRIYRDGMKADKPLSKLETMSEFDTPVIPTKTPIVIDWDNIDLAPKPKTKFKHSVPFDLAHLN